MQREHRVAVLVFIAAVLTIVAMLSPLEGPPTAEIELPDETLQR